MNETTQNRLNQIMRERNLKQRDILEMSLPYQKRFGIKMGKSALSQYVNGKSSPDQHKLYLLGATLGVDEAWLMGFDVPKERPKAQQMVAEPVLVSRLANLLHQLERPRQEKVYNFAEKQLEEQNTSKLVSFKQSDEDLFDFDWCGYVSAGTGEYLHGELKETIQLREDQIPDGADFALTVNGDSMKPMFKDHDLIFIEETTELQNGAIGVVIVNDEAYIKKIYFNKSGMTLVSLNPEYRDIELSSLDQIKVIGKVVI